MLNVASFLGNKDVKSLLTIVNQGLIRFRCYFLDFSEGGKKTSYRPYTVLVELVEGLHGKHG